MKSLLTILALALAANFAQADELVTSCKMSPISTTISVFTNAGSYSAEFDVSGAKTTQAMELPPLTISQEELLAEEIYLYFAAVANVNLADATSGILYATTLTDEGATTAIVEFYKRKRRAPGKAGFVYESPDYIYSCE